MRPTARRRAEPAGRRRALLAALLLVPGMLLAGAGPLRAEAPQQEIRQTFEEARAAVLSGDGGRVLRLLSRGSLARLETVRAAARSPGDQALDRLGPADRLAVLSLRRTFTAAELRRLRTPELVSRLLAKGWLRPELISNSALGTVTLKGGRASAPLLVHNRPTIVPAEFVREGGQGWRVDLTRSLAMADRLLRALATVAGRSDDAYIEELAGRLRH